VPLDFIIGELTPAAQFSTQTTAMRVQRAKFQAPAAHPVIVDGFVRNRFEHVPMAIDPMAIEKLAGKTKFVATKVIASSGGTAAFHRIAEIHFPSLD